MILHFKYLKNEIFYFDIFAEMHIEGIGTLDISIEDLASYSYHCDMQFNNQDEMMHFIYEYYDIDPDHLIFNESEIAELYEEYKEKISNYS